jgi:hypothetical protein
MYQAPPGAAAPRSPYQGSQGNQPMETGGSIMHTPAPVNAAQLYADNHRPVPPVPFSLPPAAAEGVGLGSTNLHAPLARVAGEGASRLDSAVAARQELMALEARKQVLQAHALEGHTLPQPAGHRQPVDAAHAEAVHRVREVAQADDAAEHRRAIARCCRPGSAR